MEPTYKQGDILFARKLYVFSPKTGDCVIVKVPFYNQLFVKRIYRIQNGTFFVIGDNPQASTDSRDFGWIERKYILAVVFYKVAK